jgi:hypothetical protein
MPDDPNNTAGSDCSSTPCSAIRRRFNSVGCPKLPEKPTIPEIAQWLDDLARWEQLQPAGREMDAREWAATCLQSTAEDLRQNT